MHFMSGRFSQGLRSIAARRLSPVVWYMLSRSDCLLCVVCCIASLRLPVSCCVAVAVQDRCTALVLACHSKEWKVAGLLVAKGCELNVRTRKVRSSVRSLSSIVTASAGWHSPPLVPHHSALQRAIQTSVPRHNVRTTTVRRETLSCSQCEAKRIVLQHLHRGTRPSGSAL
jgi:hypothetical protein